MKIAILGFGTVGSGVYNIVKNNKLKNIEIKKILRKHIKNDELKNITTNNFNDILEDDEIDTIVECIGGNDVSYECVIKAMEKKKNVVSANKLLIATHYNELVNTAKKNNIQFLFEAAVGGGIPFIENLTRIARIDKIHKFEGILNGTTNYILYKMLTENADIDEVVKQAQEMGFAELDPSSDIDGDDLVYKTIIAANIASKKSYINKNIFKTGIRYISKEDMEYFKNKNKIIKFIGEFDDDKNSIVVMPQAFAINEQIALTPLNHNFIRVHCETNDNLIFSGQGAGSLPTAHSIIQDLFRIIDKVYIPELKTEEVSVNYESYKGNFYIRFNDGKISIKENVYLQQIIDIYNSGDTKFILKIN